MNPSLNLIPIVFFSKFKYILNKTFYPYVLAAVEYVCLQHQFTPNVI